MSDCYGTEDVFEMIEDNNDDFTLQEIIPGPGVAPGGYTGMVLKKKSDANYDTEWDYQGSGGILLTGQCETYNDLPADPEQGEAWAVGEEAPYECYAWFGEWIDLGEIFPSGVSPEVTITEITGGTRITITDAQHPDGQSADIMNGVDGQDGAQGPEGPAGPGVPTGGSAGQFLKKSSSTNYDTEWDTMGADDVGYDGSQSYTAGTAGKKIKDLDAELTLAENSVTPYVVGNTNTTGVKLDPGVFVWVKNHSTLSDGLYTVKTTAIVSGGSVVDTNMEHVDTGGLNTLRNTFKRKTVSCGNATLEISGNICILQMPDVEMPSFQSNFIPNQYKPHNKVFGVVSRSQDGTVTSEARVIIETNGSFILQINGLNTTAVVRGQVCWII